MSNTKSQSLHRPHRSPPALLLLVLLFVTIPALFFLSPFNIFPNRSLSEATDLQSSSQTSDLAVVQNDGVAPLEGEEALAKILELTADILDVLSKQHQSPSLASLSSTVRSHVFNTHETHLIESAAHEVGKRGLLDSITSALGGAVSGALSSAGSLLPNISIDSLAMPAMYLGDGIGGGAAVGLKLVSNGTAMPATAGPPATGLNLIAKNLGMGLTSTLLGAVNISSLGSGASLSDAATSLGSGLGSGVSKGLSLSNATSASGMTTSNGTANATGIGAVAGSLGFGLTSALFSSINVSSLAGGFSTDQLSGAIVAAGTGLGSGAAQGLQKVGMVMTAPVASPALQKRATTGGIDVNGITQNFTQSLSSSFLGSLDLKALTSMATTGVSTSNITQMIGPVLLGAGVGFGSGTAQGLGLQKILAPGVLAADADASSVANNFAYDLSTSFLANGTISALGSKIMEAGGSGGALTGVTGMLGSIAEGVGSGLGQGASVGLGFQNATPSMGNDVAAIAKSFSFGLASSFLENGTVSMLTSGATSLFNSTAMSSTFSNISVSKAAEGLARGLVDGAGTSIQNAGGFQAILGGGNMTSIMAAAAAPIMTNDFDDSTGGLASGFGRGLGGEGVNLVLAAIGQPVAAAVSSVAPQLSSTASMAALPAPTSSPAGTPTPAITPDTAAPLLNSTGTNGTVLSTQRSLSPRSPPRVVISPALQPRNLAPRAANMTGIFTGLNATATNQVVQKAVDTLTCDGIGGAVQLFLGLQSSGTFTSFLSSNTSVNLTGMLPDIDLTINNAGNRYDINPGTLDIKVNGQGIIKFIIIIALHAILTITVYMTLIPAALFLENARGIAINMRRPAIWAKTGKWTRLMWQFAIIPLALIGFILGILVLNIGRHFQTAHGISGLLAFIFTIPAAIFELPPVAPMLMSNRKLQLARAGNMGLVLLFGLISFISGLDQIRVISICAFELPGVAVSVINILLMITFLGALSTVALNFLTARWAAMTLVNDPSYNKAEFNDQDIDRSMEKSPKYTDEETPIPRRAPVPPPSSAPMLVPLPTPMDRKETQSMAPPYEESILNQYYEPRTPGAYTDDDRSVYPEDSRGVMKDMPPVPPAPRDNRESTMKMMYERAKMQIMKDKGVKLENRVTKGGAESV